MSKRELFPVLGVKKKRKERRAELLSGKLCYEKGVGGSGGGEMVSQPEGKEINQL